MERQCTAICGDGYELGEYEEVDAVAFDVVVRIEDRQRWIDDGRLEVCRVDII